MYAFSTLKTHWYTVIIKKEREILLNVPRYVIKLPHRMIFYLLLNFLCFKILIRNVFCQRVMLHKLFYKFWLYIWKTNYVTLSGLNYCGTLFSDYNTFLSRTFPSSLVSLLLPFVVLWYLPSSLPAEFPADTDELVAEDDDAEDCELFPGGGLELKFPWSCIDKKYLVAACLSCSRSSAVCRLLNISLISIYHLYMHLR